MITQKGEDRRGSSLSLKKDEGSHEIFSTKRSEVSGQHTGLDKHESWARTSTHAPKRLMNSKEAHS